MIFDKESFECGKVNFVRSETENQLCNPACTGINRLSPRSNLVPAKKNGIYFKNKEESDFLIMLNGDYGFSYRPSDDIPDFYKVDFDDSDWDTIDVPSMWQYRGYGQCKYPNTCYPIPFDPPYVRCENPVGYYRKGFTLSSVQKNTILHFCGVDNAFYVYLNGEFVGFSKGSRIPAEFDVADKLRVGENLLCVKVFTYSDATYLENQDMLLASGIFRDVYLIGHGETSVWDYRVRTEYDSISVEITPFAGFCDAAEVQITLDDMKVSLPISETVSHTFKLENPRLWNAETPNLYDLTIALSLGSEIIELHSKKVGIMRTEVKDNQFLVNGKPVYIKGINRHEYNCKNGRTLSVEQIESELRLIKAHNLNAVRCAHYTNHPATYEIATEIGLYLMDEADIETHGAMVTGDQGYISKLPEWYPSYIDRVRRMCESNKNETCIFMWSIGNECGQGENIRRCFDYIREYDPTRDIMQVQDDPFDPEFISFRKAGYRSMAFIKEKYTEEGLPLVFVEYAHAMGNSPGYLEGYWDYIYSHKHTIGGFVWELKNHGFYCEDEKGRPFYKYGGDFGEYCHWANFSLDGLLLSDGTPKPTWYELSEVSSPIYAKYEDGKVKLLNTNDFISAEYITLKWEINEDYTTVKCGEMQLPAIEPHCWFCPDIDLNVENRDNRARYYLNLHYYDGEKRLASKQFSLTATRSLEKHRKTNAADKIYSEDNHLCIEGDCYSVKFKDGLIDYYKVNGKELICDSMDFCFHRAPTDNDGIEKFKRRHISKWNNIFLKEFKFRLASMSVERKDSFVEIVVGGKCCPESKFVGYTVEIRYEVYPDGKVLFDIVGDPYGRMTEVIPRIGVVFPLNRAFDDVTWYGRGKHQSYSDCTLSAPIGLYSSKIDDMNFMYDYPQETGNREGTSFVRINDGENGLCIASNEYFSFSYHNFTLENLTDAFHCNEIERSEQNYLYVDYKNRPLGSLSCGPDPEPEFELYPHKFRFVFVLSADEGNEKALEATRTDFGTRTEALSDKYVPTEEVRTGLMYADCDIN